jgi:biotin carboxyl carrier protein
VTGGHVVAAEIAGSVWQVSAAVGAEVEAGEVLVVLESMKLEIPVVTDEAGTVTELLVAEGDAVEEGQALAVVSPRG